MENGQTFAQSYNAENRLSVVLLVSGTCAENGTLLAGWYFTYDGDGNRVKQVYTDGTGTLTTYYLFGGAYEVQDDGTTETVRKYYAFAGMTIAMNDGSGLKYFITDHLGSVVAVTDASGALLSEQRYMPFGQVGTLWELCSCQFCNRGVLLVSGTCAENGTLLAGWYFTYDGDGNLMEKTEPSGILSL